MEHPYSTRSKSSPDTPKSDAEPQLVRNLDDTAKQPPALASSSKVSQETFLKVFQLDVADPIPDVLSEKQ